MKRRDLSGLDRNLDLLAQEIAFRGSRLFGRTTSAACASASVSRKDRNSHFTAADDVQLGGGERIVIRERTARDGEEVRIYPLVYLVGTRVDRGGTGLWSETIFGYADSWNNSQKPYVASGMGLEGVCSHAEQSCSLCAFSTGWTAVGLWRGSGSRWANAATAHTQSISWTQTSLMRACW